MDRSDDALGDDATALPPARSNRVLGESSNLSASTGSLQPASAGAVQAKFAAPRGIVNQSAQTAKPLQVRRTPAPRPILRSLHTGIGNGGAAAFELVFPA